MTTAKTKTTDEPGTDVARFDPTTSAFPVLFAQEGDGSFAEVMADNFGDEGFSAGDLPRIVTPSGGGQSWDVPDADPTRVLEGVVVVKQPTRSMWVQGRGDSADGDGDGPPDCASSDGKIGIGLFGKGSEGNPTGECDGCPMAQYGTADKGAGQKCKAKLELYMLFPGNVLPVHVTLPPTSLKPWRTYMTSLLTKGVSFMTVTTKIALTVAKGPSGNYSVAAPSLGRPLSPEEGQAARTYGHIIRQYLDKSSRERDEARQRAVAEATDGEPATS